MLPGLGNLLEVEMMDKIEIEPMPILDFSHLPLDWHGFDLVCPTVRMSKEEFEKMFPKARSDSAPVEAE